MPPTNPPSGKPKTAPEGPAKDPRWYRDGLRFECTGCGNCCKNHGDYTYVYLATVDVLQIAEHLDLAPADFVSKYCREEEGWTTIRMDAPACPFLGEGNSCDIYPVRPKQCATWPYWEENLKRATWEGSVKECCPGIGKGELTSADEVDRIAEETEEWYE